MNKHRKLVLKRFEILQESYKRIKIAGLISAGKKTRPLCEEIIEQVCKEFKYKNVSLVLKIANLSKHDRTRDYIED